MSTLADALIQALKTLHYDTSFFRVVTATSRSSGRGSASALIVAPEVLPKPVAEYPGMTGDALKPVPQPVSKEHRGDLSGMLEDSQKPDVSEKVLTSAGNVERSREILETLHR